MTPLDSYLREVAVSRADEKRAEAADLQRQADALIAGAKVIERTWGIAPPCHLCGRRDCGH